MAELVDRNTSLDEHCAMCHNGYRQPKLLKCLHSFCACCLLEKLNGQDNHQDNIIVCPICLTETKIPRGGVCELVSNDALRSRLALQNSLQLMKRNNISQCQSCSREAEICARCLHQQCRHFLCASCVKAHQEMVVFRNHRLVTLAEIDSNEATSASSKKCSRHPQYPLTFHCEPCEEFTCRSCASEHLKKRHRVVKIAQSTEVSSRRESLKKAIPKLKEIATQFRRAAIIAEETKQKIEDYRKFVTQSASRAHSAKFMALVLLEAGDIEFMKLYPVVSAAIRDLKAREAGEIPCMHNVLRNGNEQSDEGNSESATTEYVTAEESFASQIVDEARSETQENENENNKNDGRDLNSVKRTIDFDEESVYSNEEDVDEEGTSNSAESDTEYPEDNKSSSDETNMDDNDRSSNTSELLECLSNTSEVGEYQLEFDQKWEDTEEPIVSENKNLTLSNGRSESPMETQSWHRVGKFGKMGTRLGRFNCAKGVSVGYNGDVAVADHTNNRVDVFSLGGDFKFTLKNGKQSKKKKGYFPNAEDVAFNSNNHIFVVDQSKYVYEFSIEGNYMKKFSVLGDDNLSHTKVCSSCIAIDKKDRIYVGDCKRDVISTFKRSGDHIRTVNVTIPPVYLAINDYRQMLVTGTGDSKILSIQMSKDPPPMKEFTLGEKIKVHCFTGVAWDTQTEGFFVATQQKKRGKGQVHYFSSSGEYVESIGDFKLNNPLGLAMSPTNVLVVADMLSVKLFHRDKLEYSQ